MRRTVPASIVVVGWLAVAVVDSIAAAAVAAPAAPSAADAKRWDLASTAGLELENVSAEPVTHEGRRGLRITIAPAAVPAYNAQQTAPTPIPGAVITAAGPETIAIVSGSELANGVIEVDLAGEPRPGVGPGARGFVGVAFRVQSDRRSYDAFYLRPGNARVDDQERRNHSTQYISHPSWPWERLRRDTPGRYESYVDLRPGAWTHIRIEVDGEKARLFVGGSEQPVLIVNDLKSGAQASGQVALWIEGSTLAHFANLSISRR